MSYLKHYVEYKKSDKKESDYINEDKKEQKKEKPKRDTRWQALLQLMAGIEAPKVTVTTTHEYATPVTSNNSEDKEEYPNPKEDPNYIPETPAPLWHPTEVRRYHNKQHMEGNVKKAYNYLTENWGLSSAAASGIIGNLVWENLANPTQTVADSKGTSSFGIASFNSAGRLPKLEEYMQKFGLDKNRLEHQLAYIGNSIVTEKNLQPLLDPNITPEQASEIFGRYFEIFAGADGQGYKNYQDPEHMRRKASANEIYTYFNN